MIKKQIPHYKTSKSSKTKMDVVRTCLFEVCFSDKVSKADQKILKEFIIGVKPGEIIFNLNILKNKMIPMLELLKLSKLKKPTDLVVKMHDKKGIVHTKFTYKNCIFKVNVNEILQLSHEDINVVPKAIVNFNYEKLLMDMCNKKGKITQEELLNN